LAEISPVPTVWLRFLIGLIILGLTVLLRGQFAVPERKEWGYLALLGFLGITFHQWLQSNGLQTSEAGTTAWIAATTPVFMALLGWFLPKRKTQLGENVGDPACVYRGAGRGVERRFPFGLDREIRRARRRFDLDPRRQLGAVFGPLTPRVEGSSCQPDHVLCHAIGWSFISLIFFMGNGFTEIGNLILRGWMGVGFLGIFCSGLAYIAWYDALQIMSTAPTGVFRYIEPLVAVVVAFFVLGEAFSAASLIGGALILFGVWLVNRN
jgi:drug/metabolite transporter (DMT)-like permease